MGKKTIAEIAQICHTGEQEIREEKQWLAFLRMFKKQNREQQEWIIEQLCNVIVSKEEKEFNYG